jgi:hypothetical protein
VSREIELGVGFAALGIGCGMQIGTAAVVDPGCQKLEKAILKGKDIHVTLDRTACHLHGTDKPGPPVRGSLHFQDYMVEGDQSIVSATTHVTVKGDNTPVKRAHRNVPYTCSVAAKHLVGTALPFTNRNQLLGHAAGPKKRSRGYEPDAIVVSALRRRGDFSPSPIRANSVAKRIYEEIGRDSCDHH